MATSDEGGCERPAAVTERRRWLLRRIDAALARIEAGEYGWCAACGEQIAASRLDREPITAYCVACARMSPSADR